MFIEEPSGKYRAIGKCGLKGFFFSVLIPNMFYRKLD